MTPGIHYSQQIYKRSECKAFIPAPLIGRSFVSIVPFKKADITRPYIYVFTCDKLQLGTKLCGNTGNWLYYFRPQFYNRKIY